MAMVPSRELRNDTAGVLRRVKAGEEIVVTVRGEPIAEIIPIRREKRTGGMPRDEFVRRLRHSQADPGLREELKWLAGDTTDDIPIP